MCDEWMRPLELKISVDEFQRLPRNNAYKYEYLSDRAVLSPRPKFYHAMLDLDTFAAASSAADGQVLLRPLAADDWDKLVPLFAAAFDRQEPFCGLLGEERREAARQCLDRSRLGGDGPLIESACLVAVDEAENTLVGAILMTLLPDVDPTEWGAFQWHDDPPPDCVAHGQGRPHLTWVFVHPWKAGQGVGTALLTGVVAQLRSLGYRHMASTLLPTNDSSALWHWRNGFRLLEYPGSRRRLDRRIRGTISASASASEGPVSSPSE
jgi:GNAT superfamily N-acetyltransferase